MQNPNSTGTIPGEMRRVLPRVALLEQRALDRLHEPPAPGRSVGLGSLLSVPAIVVSFTAAELAGSLFQNALGLSENESLTQAGALGVAAAVLLALLLVVPQLFGVVLGLKARRLGARRMGTAGVVLNCLLGAFVLLTMGVNLLFL